MSSAVRTFRIVEKEASADLDKIYPDFVQDYIFSTKLKNPEIRRKYGLTHREFKEISDMAKKEYNLSRRATNKDAYAKYYYGKNNSFVVAKTIDKKFVYLGHVNASEDVVKKIVELCKKASWNIEECKHIIRNYGDYLCSA